MKKLHVRTVLPSDKAIMRSRGIISGMDWLLKGYVRKVAPIANPNH